MPTLGAVVSAQPYRIDDDVHVEVRLPAPVTRLLPASTAPLVERLRRGTPAPG
jgi:hypothetical protein